MQARRTTSKMASRLGSPRARKIFARSSVPVFVASNVRPALYFDSRESVLLYDIRRRCQEVVVAARTPPTASAMTRPPATTTIVGHLREDLIDARLPTCHPRTPSGRLPRPRRTDPDRRRDLAGRAGGLGRRHASPEVDPGRQRALAVGAADARRHRPGAARLRLLRLPGALLPASATTRPARPSWRRGSGPSMPPGEPVAQREPRPGPRRVRAAADHVPRRGHSGPADVDAGPATRSTSSRSAGDWRRCATRAS